MPKIPDEKYRPDIDGLRAIAILPVILFHAFPNMLPGGFIGVDVFFVISGFLITGIILNEYQEERFSIFRFYSRRIRRIFPVLSVVLITILFVGWETFLPDELSMLGKHIAYSVAFLFNFSLLSEIGYFDISSDLKPLLHLWSLAIEEQFYLIWPLLLLISLKRKLNLFIVFMILILFSFIIDVYFVKHNLDWAFFLPQSRFWELLAGAFLAWLVNDKKIIYFFSLQPANNLLFKNNLKNILSVIGFLFIIVAVIFTDKYFFPGWWALLPVVGSCLIIASGPKAWINRNILSQKILVNIGLISFSLYLWHWPLLSWAQIMNGGVQPSVSIQCIIIALSFLLSLFSYQFIEQPFRFRFRSNMVPFVFVLLMTSIGITGVIIYYGEGFPDRSNIAPLKRQFEQYKPVPIGVPYKTCPDKYPELRYCFLYAGPDIPVRAILIGDSHAGNLYQGFNKEYLKSGTSLALLANLGCPPFVGVRRLLGIRRIPRSCFKLYSEILPLFLKKYDIRDVFIFSRGASYVQGAGYKEGKNNPIGLSLVGDGQEALSNEKVFEIGLRATFSFFSFLGKRIIYIYNIPELGFHTKQCLQGRPFNPFPDKNFNCAVKKTEFLERNKKYRTIVDSVLKDFPNVIAIDPTELFCDQEYCYGKRNNDILYQDDDHLSLAGSDLVGKYIIDKLKNYNP